MKTVKSLTVFLLVACAVAMFAAPSHANGTPQNIGVAYNLAFLGTPSSPNGTIPVGTPIIYADASGFNFGFPTTLTVVATNVSTQVATSLAANVDAPFDIDIATGTLSAGIYTLSFDNAGDGPSDIYWTLTPNLTVGNPISSPTLSSLSRTSATAGNPGFALTAAGTGFINGATIDWNGTPLATTFGSATSVSAQVPASDLTTSGSAVITVVNPDTGTTGSLPFAVLPAPTVASVTPNSANAGSSAVTLTVTGTNFVSGDTVYAGATALATTFVSATKLTATLPTSLLAAPANLLIFVQTFDGVPEGSLNFAVISTPTLTGLSPSTAKQGSAAVTVTVTGTGFASGAVAKWNSTALATTFSSATKLTAVVPSSDLTALGSFPITVVNADTGHTASMNFTVTQPTPIVGSVSPDPVPAGTAATQFTVTGSAFDSHSVVSFAGGTAITPDSIVSPTKLMVTLPAADLVRAGSFPVTVTTDGGTSGAAALVVSPVASFGAAGLKMISSPYDTSGLSIAPNTIGWIDSTTGAETDASLNIVNWNGSSYAAPTSGLTPGVGYWMRVPSLSDSNGAESLSLLVQGTPVGVNSPFKIALHSGWNLIGDPMDVPMPLASITVLAPTLLGLKSLTALQAAQDDIVGSDIYTYDSSVSSTYQDQTVTNSNAALQPYKGYWILALSPCSLEFPQTR